MVISFCVQSLHCDMINPHPMIKDKILSMWMIFTCMIKFWMSRIIIPWKRLDNHYCIALKFRVTLYTPSQQNHHGTLFLRDPWFRCKYKATYCVMQLLENWMRIFLVRILIHHKSNCLRISITWDCFYILNQDFFVRVQLVWK